MKTLRRPLSGWVAQEFTIRAQTLGMIEIDLSHAQKRNKKNHPGNSPNITTAYNDQDRRQSAQIYLTTHKEWGDEVVINALNDTEANDYPQSRLKGVERHERYDHRKHTGQDRSCIRNNIDYCGYGCE